MSPGLRVAAFLPAALIILPLAGFALGAHIPSAFIIFSLLLGLMLTGMPVSIALGLTVLTFLFTMTTVPITSVALKLFTGIEKFEIMAIPFFILAGNFLTHGGVARRMIAFATSMVGHWNGGLALAGVVACALFAAVSGSSPATVVAIGSIILPAMLKQGFPKRFGAGVITTSGALGILIPPSIVMVMYSVATNTSVGQLFMAGIVPGVVLATMLGLTTWWIARKNDYPRMERKGWDERLRAFRESVWGLLLIVVVIGGIYTGIFTPTEAAAMSAVYAFIVAVFVYKDLTLAKVPKVLLDSASMSAMLLYIITNAVLFSFLMTSEQIPQQMAEWMLSRGPRLDHLPPGGQRAAPAVAGNVMEPSSIVLIMAPILFPVAMKLGIDPVHFGILMTVNMEVGTVPPAGRAEPVRGVEHRQDGHHRAHHRGMAVARHHAGLPGDRHLLAGTLAGAAASAGHDAMTAPPPARPPGRRRAAQRLFFFVFLQLARPPGCCPPHPAGRPAQRVIILNLLGFIQFWIFPPRTRRLSPSERKHGCGTHPFDHQTRRRGQERHRRDLLALRACGTQDRRGEDDLARAAGRRRLLRGAQGTPFLQGPGRFHDLGTGHDSGAGRRERHRQEPRPDGSDRSEKSCGRNDSRRFRRFDRRQRGARVRRTGDRAATEIAYFFPTLARCH